MIRSLMTPGEEIRHDYDKWREYPLARHRRIAEAVEASTDPADAGTIGYVKSFCYASQAFQRLGDESDAHIVSEARRIITEAMELHSQALSVEGVVVALLAQR